MKSVWVVASGEYSDYRIEAVFSTKEKADAAAPAGYRTGALSLPTETRTLKSRVGSILARNATRRGKKYETVAFATCR